MVVYIEACESGSMLEDILSDKINVYGTTASNAQEPSYACYHDIERGTYLGDVYSVVWMEDSDAEQINKETLYQQYLLTQQKTKYKACYAIWRSCNIKSFFLILNFS